jgi:hypothetical protein
MERDVRNRTPVSVAGCRCGSAACASDERPLREHSDRVPARCLCNGGLPGTKPGPMQLMPLAAAEGERGWGYDGVALYAPLEAYGGPDAVKRGIASSYQNLSENHVVFGRSGCESGELSVRAEKQLHVSPRRHLVTTAFLRVSN